MLKVLFCLSSFLVCMFILFERRITVRSIFGIGTILYGLPLFFGYSSFIIDYRILGGTLYYEKIEPVIYIIFIISQLIFFVSYFLNKDKKYTYTVLKVSNKKITFFAIILLLIIFIILFLYNAGFDIFTIQYKNERLSNYNIYYVFSTTLSTLSLTYYVLYPIKSLRKWLLIPMAFLIMDLFLGTRVNAFLTIITLVLAYCSKREKVISLKNKLKFIISGGLLVFIALLYKPVYYSIVFKDFQFGDIKRYIIMGFSNNEPSTIMGTLNEIIQHNIWLPHNYFLNSILQYMPFYETIFHDTRKTFNYYFQSVLFPNTNWGLASTSYGELYTLGGISAILVFFIGILFYLCIPLPKRDYSKLLYFYISPYVLFYFYRNDWDQFISYMRIYFILIIMVFIVRLILEVFYQAIKKQRRTKKCVALQDL